MLRDILQEGVERGSFAVPNLNHMAVIVAQAIQGLDVPYIRDNLSEEGINKNMLKDYMTRLILNGILAR